MIKIVFIGIITAVLVLVVKEQQKAMGAVTLLAGSVLILVLCLDDLKSIVAMIQEMSDMANIQDLYLKILLKIIGIAYISQFASEVCQDLGNQTIGKQIEIAGKLSIFMISVPVIRALIEMMKELFAL